MINDEDSQQATEASTEKAEQDVDVAEILNGNLVHAMTHRLESTGLGTVGDFLSQEFRVSSFSSKKYGDGGHVFPCSPREKAALYDF